MLSPSFVPVSRATFWTNTATTNIITMLLLSTIVHPTETAISLSLMDGVQILWQHCPSDFRQAVRTSGGCFLYRGESRSIDSPTILNPKPDLLLPSTYNDPNALKYFEWLENELTSTLGSRETVRPSTGHLGTATEEYARAWGTPVSVWPLGGSFSYVWPRNRDFLFPGGKSMDDLVVHQDLALALKTGKEILFSTSASELELRGPAFLAFPKNVESQLRELLAASNYGLENW